MTTIEVIFFHELGHYVARELNLKYYKGTGSSEILIYPCKYNNEDYCGHVSPIVPPGINNNKPVPLSKLPEQLASISYGCIFQSYYSSTDLTDCFKNKGQKDARDWSATLIEHGFDQMKKEFANTEGEYFDELIQNESLKQIFALNPNEYLIKTEERNFHVDIVKLKIDIADFLITHQPIYNELIERYKYLINIKHKPTINNI